MADSVLLVRHGETEWSRNGRHTSVTDLPLTLNGEGVADALRKRFAQLESYSVLSSPRRRAIDTATRATGRSDIHVVEQLTEWNYGEYECRTTAEIRAEVDAAWDLWSDGCPGGESPQDVTARVMQLFAILDEMNGTVACFAHGHILRAVGALWTGQPIVLGRHLLFGTGSISTLALSPDGRVVENWNVKP